MGITYKAKMTKGVIDLFTGNKMCNLLGKVGSRFVSSRDVAKVILVFMEHERL